MRLGFGPRLDGLAAGRNDVADDDGALAGVDEEVALGIRLERRPCAALRQREARQGLLERHDLAEWRRRLARRKEFSRSPVRKRKPAANNEEERSYGTVVFFQLSHLGCGLGVPVVCVRISVRRCALYSTDARCRHAQKFAAGHTCPGSHPVARVQEPRQRATGTARPRCHTAHAEARGP